MQKDFENIHYYEGDITANNLKIIDAVLHEVLHVTKKYCQKTPKSMRVLDIGSGRGEYALAFAQKFGSVVGVEPYKKAYDFAIKNKPSKTHNIEYFHTTVEKYTSKELFDLVISLTVFEHMPNQYESFKQTFALMKPNAILYVTAPNKYWLFEQHYGLPFLSWLPLPIANKYLQLTKGVQSYEDSSYSMGYLQTKKFLSQFDCDFEFVLPSDVNSAYIGLGKKGIFTLIKKLGMWLISKNPFFWTFSKGFIIIIRKK